MNKKILLSLAALFVMASLKVVAQTISPDDAMASARAYLSQASSRAKVKGQAAQEELTLAYTQQRESDSRVCFYVFNRGTNGGFIIAGGDETAQTILCCCDNGTFDYARIPENFRWWLLQYEQQISAAIDYVEAHPQALTSAKTKAKRKSSKQTKSDIEPLVKTQWNQSEPYNNALPSLGENYTGSSALATGCVATAMAQLMSIITIRRVVSAVILTLRHGAALLAQRPSRQTLPIPPMIGITC